MKGIANRQNTLLGRKQMIRAPRPSSHPLKNDPARPETPFLKHSRRMPPAKPPKPPASNS